MQCCRDEAAIWAGRLQNASLAAAAWSNLESAQRYNVVYILHFSMCPLSLLILLFFPLIHLICSTFRPSCASLPSHFILCLWVGWADHLFSVQRLKGIVGEREGERESQPAWRGAKSAVILYRLELSRTDGDRSCMCADSGSGLRQIERNNRGRKRCLLLLVWQTVAGP